jgi:CO dehydrogenase maturation factor
MADQNSSSNNRLLAVFGKGGTGKTAFISITTRLLTELNNHKVLVIDADPSMNLSNVLGVKPSKTVGEVREEIIKNIVKTTDEEKEEIAGMLDYMIMEALSEKGKFALLVMGRPEDVGCFCPVNTLLRDAIETLSKNFDITLIDGEAGIEQINRQVMRVVDTPILLTDTSARGIETAALIKSIVDKKKVIRCEGLNLVINRIRDNEESVKRFAQKTGLEPAGFIPEDPNITDYDLVGKPLMDLPDDSPSVQAVRGILGKLGLI